MGLFDLLADVIAAPVTIPIKAVEMTIKSAESAPDLAEKIIENIENAIDEVGK